MRANDIECCWMNYVFRDQDKLTFTGARMTIKHSSE